MSDLRTIYIEEMRGRVDQLRLSLALSGAIDQKARAAALYDAHLQAHTIKGTSEQLGYTEAAALGAAMSGALEKARADNKLLKAVQSNIERGCNAMIAWLEADLGATRPLVIAAAAFSVGGLRQGATQP